MDSNQHRGTAGKTLLAFSLLAAVVAAFAVYLRATRGDSEFVSYPTGLGDTDFYTEDLGPRFDLFHPNLVFEGMPAQFPRGLYRRNHGTVHIKDSKVTKLARDKTGRHWVYTTKSPDENAPRFFLKSADGAYIEFGAQKYFHEPGVTPTVSPPEPGAAPGTNTPPPAQPN